MAFAGENRPELLRNEFFLNISTVLPRDEPYVFESITIQTDRGESFSLPLELHMEPPYRLVKKSFILNTSLDSNCIELNIESMSWAKGSVKKMVILSDTLKIASYDNVISDGRLNICVSWKKGQAPKGFSKSEISILFDDAEAPFSVSLLTTP